MIPRWSDLTDTVRLVLASLAAVAAGLALWWAYSALTAKPKAEARLAHNQSQAALQNGSDAVNVVGDAGKRDQAADDLTRSNADAISHAKGADAPVDPDARDAGLRSLCQRRAYSGDPKCLRFAPAR